MTDRSKRWRQLPRLACIGVAFALIAVAGASVVEVGPTAQASAPTDVTPRATTNTVLGEWSPLGIPRDGPFYWLGPGLNQAVYTLAEYDGFLYAGGLFDDTGGGGDTAADCSDGTLFALQCIAKIDMASTSSAWLPVGGGLTNQVDDMVVMNGELYVVGKFDDTIGGSGNRECVLGLDALPCIAKWNGSTWSPPAGGGIGTGAPEPDRLSLTWTPVTIPDDPADPDDTVVIADPDDTVVIVNRSQSAGASFRATLSGPLLGFNVALGRYGDPRNLSVAIYQADETTGLPTGGSLATATFVNPIAYPINPPYDFGLDTVSAVFSAPYLQVNVGSQYAFVLTSNDDSPAGFLLGVSDDTASNDFLLSGTSVDSLSRSTTARPLFAPAISVPSQAYALTRWDNGLLVAGGFTVASGVSTQVPGLAAWNPSPARWTAPGVGGFDSAIYALLADRVGAAYMGGEYTGTRDDSGTTKMNGAFDDSRSWSGMGGGVSFLRHSGSRIPGRVDALALLKDTVYAGGYFTATGNGSRELKNLAAWNGSSWQTVGPGLNYRISPGPATGTSVRSLAADDDRGLLYIGGTFDDTPGGSGNGACDDTTIPGGPLRCVTVWDTAIEEFIPFQWGTGDDSNGLTGEVSSFVIRGRDVYVGGNFNTNAQGGFPYQWNLKNVGKWTWMPPTGSVNASASSGQTVSITGTRFIGVPSDGVKFGSTVVPFTRSSTESITATVPDSLASGTYTISVNGVGGWANVGTVSVTQRSGGGSTTPTATPSPSPTPSASAQPTSAPSPSGPSATDLRAAGPVRPGQVKALANGVPPGTAIVLVNGRPQRSDLTITRRGMVERTGPVTMTVQTQSTQGVNQRPVDGTLSIPQFGSAYRDRTRSLPTISLTSTGNAPLSPVRVYLLPQPKDGPRGARVKDLGYLMTDAQGRIQGEVSVLARKAGAYILQINGKGSDGLVRSINLPATVGDR